MIVEKILVSASGRREMHAVATACNPSLPFAEQLKGVEDDLSELLSGSGRGMTPVFCRWFLSDAANQASMVKGVGGAAVSVVEQPPLSLTKVALWVWLVEGMDMEQTDDAVVVGRHGSYTHIFGAGECRSGLDSSSATFDMLRSADSSLSRLGGSLLDNCVRTWFFVQNVDVNYAGVVEGRNRAFSELGLTPSTRFIASTGIGGRHADSGVAVQMDSYSVCGLRSGQMRHLNAPSHLNPTYEYGVAFERATSVDYGDRRHLFISGTASIDNRGRVVWPGDVCRQTLRMLENVEALLEAGGCGWEDVGQMLVYLRDPADYAVVEAMFRSRFPSTPFVVLLAPVCRPGWLVEMECMAMKPVSTTFPEF